MNRTNTSQNAIRNAILLSGAEALQAKEIQTIVQFQWSTKPVASLALFLPLPSYSATLPRQGSPPTLFLCPVHPHHCTDGVELVPHCMGHVPCPGTAVWFRFGDAPFPHVSLDLPSHPTALLR